MSLVIMVFLALLSGVVQRALPTPSWLGYAPFPVLLGLVLYYALTATTSQTVLAALLAGMVSDALDMTPLGYTAFLYLLAGLLVHQIRGVLMVRQWSTHAMLGGAFHAAATLLCFLLLIQGPRAALPWSDGLFRAAGGLLTGAIVAPLVFTLTMRVERFLGRVHEREGA